MASQANVSKKRKFINDGIFFAEVSEFLKRMLSEDGFAGVEIKQKPTCTHIVIRCTKTTEVVKRIPQITKLLQLRHNFKEDEVKVFADKVTPRGLSARAQAQSICYKLNSGLTVRRACYGVLKFIMDNGKAKGVEIIISGKLRGARAKAMKFKEGYMITSGEATNYYIVRAVEHVLLRQGTIGVSVKIMLPHDPKGDHGAVVRPLPDIVTIKQPKAEEKEQPAFQPQEQFGAPMGYEEPQQTYAAEEFGAPQQQQQQQQGYYPPREQQQQQQPYNGGYGNPTPGGFDNAV